MAKVPAALAAYNAGKKAKSIGNVAAKKHIKKQHKAHNAGMQPASSMTGAAPAKSNGAFQKSSY